MEPIRRIAEIIDRYDDTHNYTCDVCDREVFGGERICEECRGTLPWNNQSFCPFCGRKVLEAGACLECKAKPLVTDKARSAFTHEGEAMRLVHRYKNGGKYLRRTLYEAMSPVYEREFGDAEAFVFVPMTKKAEKKRGYNQSRLLAEEFSRRTGKPVLDVTEKKRESAQQKTLGRQEREKNLEGCFHVKDRAAVKDKILLILDDTMTTGATASELATVLKRAGARKVYLLTATSVQKKDPFGKPPKQDKKDRKKQKQSTRRSA